MARTTLHRVGLAAAALAVLTAGAASAATAGPAKHKHKHKVKKYVRVSTVSYQNPCAVDGWTPVATGPEVSYCPTTTGLTIAATDHYFSASVKDASGRAVPIALVTSGVNTSGDTVNQIFCGAVKDYPIAPGSYGVMPAIAVGDASCPVPATQGTITVRVSNLK